eukprot:344645_1
MKVSPEMILLISSVCWSFQHVITVLPREYLIKKTNEICYTYSRIAFNLTWYSINIALYKYCLFDTNENTVLYGIGVIIPFIIRLLAFYDLILCLLVAPSQFDISSQRDHNRRKLQQIILDDVEDADDAIDNKIEKRQNTQTCCSSKATYNLPEDSDQVAVYGLSHITRHPMLGGFILYFVSFLLHNVIIADLFFYVPQILQIICGIAHQEYRMKKDKRYDYYFEHTSLIPFIALIQGRTSIHWTEIKRILFSIIIITVLLGIIFAGLFTYFGQDVIIDEIDNHFQGGFVIWIYIIFLIIVDIISICTG